ncbi:MAG: nicotinate (nicotinamide) nucleotide adenylyltransferase [Oscillospiraceae bacterium]|nr:nicotinate (nicotinamide) nucleotide adenylyltransferase [Oscillospiraceae bacterium]
MRIGIYGGSFDPPHLGHLHAAVAAAKYLALDELLLMPALVPPHKELASLSPSAEHRAAMTDYMAQQAALETGVPVRVSRMELRRGGKSYTADTVRALRGEYPDAEFWLLMGTDMFLTFQNWREPEAILAEAGICAFGRSESDTEELFAVQREYLSGRFPSARIVTMALPDLVPVSSTKLRAMLPDGAAYLAPQVYGYILRERLYGTALDLKRLTIEQLRPVALSYLKAKRVPHVLGVEREAARLAERNGADVEKARFAALLHDCTKRLEPGEQLALCERYRIELDDLERAAPKLLHAKTGAAVAREVFGAPPDVCDAIRWHTTGRAGMTLLEKIVYLADYIEPNRDFDGVDALRAAVYEDLDKGLELGLRMSVEELRQRGSPLHRNTREAWEYIRKQLGETNGVERTQ